MAKINFEIIQEIEEQDICPICGGKIIEKTIDYSDWSNGRLLVIRSVPVRECESGGHRFVQAKVARSLEQFFEADRQGRLEPAETMTIPVVKFALAA